ncbi:restriction endonuclease subunit S, partial [Lactobacillus crispatus]|nr:restriction endonuclease subunit S [Lactobacillus crispatus]
LKVLSNLDVAVPPITEQDKFLSFVQQVDKSKVAVQKSLEETQTLFDSLMQKYFG